MPTVTSAANQLSIVITLSSEPVAGIGVADGSNEKSGRDGQHNNVEHLPWSFQASPARTDFGGGASQNEQETQPASAADAARAGGRPLAPMI